METATINPLHNPLQPLEARTIQRVVFDPTNDEHRRIAARLLTNNGTNQINWTGINTRFVVDRPYTDIVSSLRAKLTEYYLQAEFSDHFIC